MRTGILLLLLLLWRQDSVRSIRLVRLRIPAQAASGKDALFGCQFNLEGDLLYSVKWYKDGHEIYRYVPKNPPDKTSIKFERPGVTIDLSRSSSDVVTLTDLQPESAGVYRCEVTGEAPDFALAADETHLTIYVTPKTGPRITGLRFQYNIGDRLSANCTSPGSRPEANLLWLVNNKPVHRAHLRGPWHRVVEDPPDTMETTLGLHFMVLQSHYRRGVLQIKCQALIPPLYRKESEVILSPPEPEPDSTELDLDFAVDASTPPLIPSMDSIDKESPQLNNFDEDDKRMREEFVNKVRETFGTMPWKPPPKESESIYFETTTANSQNLEGSAALTVNSLGAMAAALVMQVILL